MVVKWETKYHNLISSLVGIPWKVLKFRLNKSNGSLINSQIWHGIGSEKKYLMCFSRHEFRSNNTHFCLIYLSSQRILQNEYNFPGVTGLKLDDCCHQPKQLQSVLSFLFQSCPAWSSKNYQTAFGEPKWPYFICHNKQFILGLFRSKSISHLPQSLGFSVSSGHHFEHCPR